jgi:hypothetical protein
MIWNDSAPYYPKFLLNSSQKHSRCGLLSALRVWPILFGVTYVAAVMAWLPAKNLLAADALTEVCGGTASDNGMPQFTWELCNAQGN